MLEETGSRLKHPLVQREMLLSTSRQKPECQVVTVHVNANDYEVRVGGFVH